MTPTLYVQLTAHFRLSEFEHGDTVPDELIPIFRALCRELLEPIRTRFEVPIIINSGYRSPEHNTAVGGAPTSQHIATEHYCACDFRLPVDLQVAFDWIRLASGLPFDQVILEHATETSGPVCIHISYAEEEYRRIAGEMLTHGRGIYTHREVGNSSTQVAADVDGEIGV